MGTALFDLAGRTTLVTGGGQGIGAGIAQVLAEAGARLVIADLDLALAEHGITVNLVLPGGGVATPGAITAPGPKPEGPACRPPPLGMCEPRDIGAAVLFFALPAAARVTNQMVAVDAGWTVT